MRGHMTYDELVQKVEAAVPGAAIEENHTDGELIIYTGLRLDGDDNVVPHVDPDEQAMHEADLKLIRKFDG